MVDKNKHKRWSKEEEIFLKEHVSLKDDDARLLFEKHFETSLSLFAYQKKRREMGLQKIHGRGKSGLRL